MTWLYESPRPVATKHNGTMRLHRFFGVWKLKGYDGTEQATPYMIGLWRKVLHAVVRRDADVRRCLMLGVATGGSLGLVQRTFDDVDVVGVDWEPALFDLGTELGVFRPDARVRFIEGDAAEIVPTLEGPFDLVLLDLFYGRKVADAVSDPRLQDAVAALLAPRGFVCVNYFDQPATLDGWRSRLGVPEIVHYQGNRIAVFRRAE